MVTQKIAVQYLDSKANDVAAGSLNGGRSGIQWFVNCPAAFAKLARLRPSDAL